MSNKQFFVSLLVNAKCGGGRPPVRRGGSQPAAGAAQNLAQCDILREQPGRRPARDCVKHRTAPGPVCVTAIGRSVITYFCLLSISDGALGRKRRGKCWWSDGRDRQIRIFRCSKRNFRLRLYRNIPLSAALCSCKRVRLSFFAEVCWTDFSVVAIWLM